MMLWLPKRNSERWLDGSQTACPELGREGRPDQSLPFTNECCQGRHIAIYGAQQKNWVMVVLAISDATTSSDVRLSPGSGIGLYRINFLVRVHFRAETLRRSEIDARAT